MKGRIGVARVRWVGGRRSRALQSAHAEPLKLFSPSKINVFLRILRRREDGFHELASLFHVIDFGDTLTFTPATQAEDSLTCNEPGIPTDKTNLVFRALDLFRKHTGSEAHFDVELEKCVPHGAGLGGGSGNAATTLWAANELAGRPATNSQLLDWSGEIGSDISVFFSQGAAYCTGRGECVQNVDSPQWRDTPMVLIKPSCALSTGSIFRALDLNNLSNQDPEGLLSALQQAGRVQPQHVVNDLEEPAFRILPLLADLKSQLSSSGLYDAVFMTGSGSTIVGIGSKEVPGSVRENPDLLIQPAKLITRPEGEWYSAP